jgi:hypothetical protein
MESSGVVIAERPVRRIESRNEKPPFPRRIEDNLLQKAELLRTTQGSTLTKISIFVSGLPEDLRDKAGRAKLRALEIWDGREKFSGVFAAVLPYDVLIHHGERLNAIMNPPEERAAA